MLPLQRERERETIANTPMMDMVNAHSNMNAHAELRNKCLFPQWDSLPRKYQANNAAPARRVRRMRRITANTHLGILFFGSEGVGVA